MVSKRRFNLAHATITKRTSTSVRLEADRKQFQRGLLVILAPFLLLFGCMLSTGTSFDAKTWLACLPFLILGSAYAWAVPTNASLLIDIEKQRLSGKFHYAFNRKRKLNISSDQFKILYASPSDKSTSMHTISLIGPEYTLGINFFKHFGDFKFTKRLVNKFRFDSTRAVGSKKRPPKNDTLMIVCYCLIGTGLILLVATLLTIKIDFLIIVVLVGAIVRKFEQNTKRSKLLASAILIGIYLLFWFPAISVGYRFLSLIDLSLAVVFVIFFMRRLPALDPKQAKKYTSPSSGVIVSAIVLAVVVIAYGLLTWL